MEEIKGFDAAQTKNSGKTLQIKIRVSRQEYAAIKKMANAMHMNVSDFMRYLAFNLASKVKEEKE